MIKCPDALKRVPIPKDTHGWEPSRLQSPEMCRLRPTQVSGAVSLKGKRCLKST
jgi:hypothetical protein